MATYLIYTSKHQLIYVREFTKVILLFVIKTDVIRICAVVDDSQWQNICTHV